jgi:hypothetical protein
MYSRAVRGYRRRLLILAAFAACACAIAEIAALLAAVLQPTAYIKNPYSHFIWWVSVLFAVLVPLIRLRAVSAAAGLALGGGAANGIDSYVWPGGVPDYIQTDWPDGTWNVGDLFLSLGWALAVLVLLSWPIVRRRHRKEGQTRRV